MQTESQQQETASDSKPAISLSVQSLRVLIYIAIVALSVILMLILPVPASTFVLVALVLGSIAYGVRQLYVIFKASNTASDLVDQTPMRTLAVPVLWRLPRLTMPRWGPLEVLLRHLRNRAAFYTPVFTLCSVGLMIYSGYLFATTHDEMLPTTAFWVFLAGTAALGAALGLAPFGKPQPPVMALSDEAIQPRTRSLWWLAPTFLGISLLVILSEINGMFFKLEGFQQVSSHIQFALLFGGVMLLAWGLGGAPSLRKLRQSARELDRREVLIVVVILGLALFMRVWLLDTGFRSLIDELHWSDAIRHLNWDPNTRLLTQMSGQSPYTWIFPYWEAGGAAIFGRNLVGLRFAASVVGVFTVLAAYGLTRALFDRRTAIFAGLICAVLPGHVHFSRIAMTLITDPLFGTLMLMFMARGWKYNRRIDWAFAGVSLGMTQYFYEGGRLLYPPLALGWIVLMFLVDRKPLLRRLQPYWKGLVILAVAGIIVAIPPYYTIFAGDGPLTGRMNDSGLGGQYYRNIFSDGVTVSEVMELIDRWSQPFRYYVQRSEVGAMYMGGDQPLVNDVLVPFFLLGTAFVIWRWRRPANVVVLWVVAAALGNALFLRDNLVSPRYVVVMPALAILIAAGARYIMPLLWQSSRETEPIMRRLIPAGLVGAATVFLVWYYFNPYLELFNRQVRDYKGYRDGVDAALRAAELPGDTQVVLISMPEHDQGVPRNFYGYLVTVDPYALVTYRPDQVTGKYLSYLPRDRNYAFFVDVTEPEIVDLIYRNFDDVEPPQYTTVDMHPDREYVLLFVPRFPYDVSPPTKP